MSDDLVKRLRVVALQVSKRDGSTTTQSMIQSWGFFCSDEEAIGAAVAKVDDLKPGFSVDQYLVCSPDSDRIEAQAAEIERLREAGNDLGFYAGHEDACDCVKGWAKGPCNCGYTEAWQAWHSLAGKEHLK